MIAYTPKTYGEVPASLGSFTEHSRILGGGTDYIIRLNTGMANPDALCYLGHVKEFRAIESTDTAVIIGAYATMTEMENHPVIRTHFPALMDAAADVGSLQIRNRGTIGGNIANASPAGDLIPVLYLYDAVIEVIGPAGSRMIPMGEIIERPGKTVLAYNEAICRIHLPMPAFKSAFVKLGTRKKVTISRIGAAVGLTLEAGVVKTAKVIIGAISIRPVTLQKAEEFLVGKLVTEENILTVAGFLADLIYEITPEEFDRDYKVSAARGVISDVFELLTNR